MSTLAAINIESHADETPPVFKDLSGSREIIQGAWAWIKFDGGSVGAGAPTITAAFNVASLTDNATGRYTINFSTNLPSADYCIVGQASYPTAGSAYIRTVGVESDTYAAGSVNVESGQAVNAGALEEGYYLNFVVFANP